MELVGHAGHELELLAGQVPCPLRRPPREAPPRRRGGPGPRAPRRGCGAARPRPPPRASRRGAAPRGPRGCRCSRAALGLRRPSRQCESACLRSPLRRGAARIRRARSPAGPSGLRPRLPRAAARRSGSPDRTRREVSRASRARRRAPVARPVAPARPARGRGRCCTAANRPAAQHRHRVVALVEGPEVDLGQLGKKHVAQVVLAPARRARPRSAETPRVRSGASPRRRTGSPASGTPGGSSGTRPVGSPREKNGPSSRSSSCWRKGSSCEGNGTSLNSSSLGVGGLGDRRPRRGERDQDQARHEPGVLGGAPSLESLQERGAGVRGAAAAELRAESHHDLAQLTPELTGESLRRSLQPRALAVGLGTPDLAGPVVLKGREQTRAGRPAPPPPATSRALAATAPWTRV